VAGSLPEYGAKPGWLLYATSDCAKAKRLVTDQAWVQDWVPELLVQGIHTTTTTENDGTVIKPYHSDVHPIAKNILDAWVDQLLLASSDGVLVTTGGNGFAASQIGMVPADAVWVFYGPGLRGVGTGSTLNVCEKLGDRNPRVSKVG